MSKHPPRPVDHNHRRALDVWRRYVSGLPAPPLAWVELAEAVVAKLGTSNPDQTLALALLVLDNAYGTGGLREGGWIMLASVHRYTYFEGRGWGDARTARLCETIVDVAWEQGLLSDWDRTLLLDQIDADGELNGRGSRRARVIDDAFVLDQLDALADRFAQDMEARGRNELVRKMVALVGAFIADEATRTVQFGRLDPDAFALFLHETDRDGLEDEPTRRDANRALLFMTAELYRWLGAAHHLSLSRANKLAARLSAHALSAASDLAVA